MLVYAIRHGESEANAGQIHAGWSQTPLTEKGKAQAKVAGEKLKGVRFDRVVSSDLRRAVQTCENALPGVLYETDALLRENNVGTLTNIAVTECEQRYGEAYRENRRQMDFTAYGGENQDMLLERAGRFLDGVAQSNCETMAVFTHAGLLRAMLSYVTGVRQQNERFACKNCCIAIFEFDGKDWRLNAWGI